MSRHGNESKLTQAPQGCTCNENAIPRERRPGAVAAQVVFAAVMLAAAASTKADDIGFGLVKGIKVYDYGGNKVTKIYLADDATYKTLVSCEGVANLTHSLHADPALKHMVAMAVVAYSSGKKVRISSSANTCEADFVALQESYF